MCIRDSYKREYDALKAITPDIPITTNLMGFYKPLDYKMWAKYMDVVSWDNYPSNEDSPAQIAMSHDLMRGINGEMCIRDSAEEGYRCYSDNLCDRFARKNCKR